jgi:hypothetical protein
MSNLFEISKDEPGLSHGEMMQQATLNVLDAATTDAEAQRLGPLRRCREPRIVDGKAELHPASETLVGAVGLEPTTAD